MTTMTPKQLRDAAWALDKLTAFTLCILEPFVAMKPMNAATVDVTVHLTSGDDPMPREDAVKLLEWVKGTDMQDGLRAAADELERSSNGGSVNG